MILWLINILFILFFVWLLAKRWGSLKNKLFWSSFFCHLLGGIAVGLVYKFYYTTSDTWLFFEQASKVADLATRNFSEYVSLLFDFSETQNPIITIEDFRSMIFLKIVSVFCFISGNSYWICAAYFSVLSFASSWFLFLRVQEIFPQEKIAAALAFLFFPSVIFWSSGIQKDTPSLTALYFLSAMFLLFLTGKKIKPFLWLVALVSVFVLSVLKYYWAVVFFMAILAAVLAKFLSLRFKPIEKNVNLSFLVLFFLVGLGASFMHPNFYLNRFLDVLVVNHDEFFLKPDNGNLIHYFDLNPSLRSILINSPWALISGIFRPVLFEGRGLLGFIASIENLFILILFFGFLLRLKQKKWKLDLLFLITISYCTVLCIFMALSTPNLGTLSRYRIGFLPFLIFLFAYQNPFLVWAIKKLNLQK